MIFDNLTFRSSAVDNIMSASGKIIQGNITFLREVYVQEVYGYKKEIGSKYFQKGTECEEGGIDMLTETLLRNCALPARKNEVEKNNGFIKGSCDVDFGGIIFDIKNAWDWNTLHNAEMTSAYEYQLRCYMELWGRETAILFYCLQNMPESILQAEERKMFYNGTDFVSFEDPSFLSSCEVLREKFNFEKFPIESRFRVWEIKHDPIIIEKIQEKIVLCRAWLNDYHEKMQNLEKNNKLLIRAI